MNTESVQFRVRYTLSLSMECRTRLVCRTPSQNRLLNVNGVRDVFTKNHVQYLLDR